MDKENGRENALDRLQELEQFATYSPYSRVLYRLIVEWIERSQTHARDLYEVFVSFLDTELEYHQALRDVAADSPEDLPEWTLLCGRKAAELCRTLARLVDITTDSGPPVVVRHLLCAECFQQLGRPDLVVTGMRAAIDHGCDHPLVFFTLGYNLYTRAVKEYTTFDPATCRQIIAQPDSFERECQHAVQVLRQGLRGGVYDAQLYWWIGAILENVGAHREARRAFQEVARRDPETATAMQDRLNVFAVTILDACSQEECDRLSGLPEITAGEIQETFRDIESVSDLIGKG